MNQKSIFDYITDPSIHRFETTEKTDMQKIYGLEPHQFDLLKKPVDTETDLLGLDRKVTRCSMHKFPFDGKQ